MKRKIALILAGCLAISPVSAGLYTTQAFAAETDTISEAAQQTPLVVEVKDENDVTLTESGKETEAEKYTIEVGETRRLTAHIEQGSDSPVLSEWSSDAPEIISIDDEGVITAQSAGAGKISLSISGDADQDPLLIEFEIIVISGEDESSDTVINEETSEIDADETADASASAEAAAETPQAEDPVIEENSVKEAAEPVSTEQTENASESATAATTEETAQDAAVATTEEPAQDAVSATTEEAAQDAAVATTEEPAQDAVSATTEEAAQDAATATPEEIAQDA
ncbi:MAG: Ig-like domain-containing protein, partial [Lachnospiraceae bacterium]|nr:Ig-like domain-containing protein [Lachnospiraceae bacterium]